MIYVHIIRANNLDKKDFLSLSDPYVVVKFMGQKKKTKVHKNTLNPAFDETFKFKLPAAYNFKYIEFEVYDHDRVSKNDLIGKAYVSLTSFVNDKTPQIVDLFLSGSKEGVLTVSLFADELEKTIDDDINKYREVPF
ncbi:hypothetical protein ABK040_003669 [Willaertia magna]